MSFKLTVKNRPSKFWEKICPFETQLIVTVKLKYIVSLWEYCSIVSGRVAESTEEVSNLRPPRLIHEDGIIRPYNRVEAEGYDLFEVWVTL